MQKPKLQNSALPSTAISKNLMSATYLPHQSTLMKPSFRDSSHPMINSFYKGSIKNEGTGISSKTNIFVEKESKSKD